MLKKHPKKEFKMKLLVILFLAITIQSYSQDSTKAYDPCNDQLLIKLAQKDSLTDTEMNTYVQLRRLCDESKTRNELNTTIQESQKQTSSALSFYYILAGISLLVSIIYLISI